MLTSDIACVIINITITRNNICITRNTTTKPTGHEGGRVKGENKMKTLEQVTNRIENLRQQIEWVKENRTKEEAIVAQKIAKNANDPEYVAKWLNNWMNGINNLTAHIEECTKEMLLLEWVLEE